MTNRIELKDPKWLCTLSVAGGAGKTPLSLFLAVVAADIYKAKSDDEQGIPVYLWDLDPQSSLTHRIVKHNPDLVVDGQSKNVFNGHHIATQAQQVTMYGQSFWFIASDVETEECGRIDTDQQLAAIRDQMQGECIIIADLPPRQCRIVENFVNIADGVFIPCHPDKERKGINGFERALDLIAVSDSDPIVHSVVTKYRSRLKMDIAQAVDAHNIASEHFVTHHGTLPYLSYSGKDPEFELLNLFSGTAAQFLDEVINREE